MTPSNTTATETDRDEPDLYHLARGTFRRLAEDEYHQPRQLLLTDYWHRPSGEEVVQAMVEKGFSEEKSREGVRHLWRVQMQKVRQ